MKLLKISSVLFLLAFTPVQCIEKVTLYSPDEFCKPIEVYEFQVESYLGNGYSEDYIECISSKF